MSFKDLVNQAKELKDQATAVYQAKKADGTIDETINQAKAAAEQGAAVVKAKIDGFRQ